MGRKKKDLTNKKIGKLLVINEIGRTRSGGITWKCICDCGNEVNFSSDHLTRKIRPVKSCGCIRKSQKGNNHPQWKGYGEISGGWWRDHVIRSAEGSNLGKSTRRPLELTLTIEEAWGLFLKQDRKCALSGVGIKLSTKSIYNTASVDRIDSSKGYTLDNVQWVHKDVNKMKNVYSQKYFIDMCKKIANKF